MLTDETKEVLRDTYDKVMRDTPGATDREIVAAIHSGWVANKNPISDAELIAGLVYLQDYARRRYGSEAV